MNFVQAYNFSDPGCELDDAGLQHLLATRSCSHCHQPIPYSSSLHPVYLPGFSSHVQNKLSRHLFWLSYSAHDLSPETTDISLGWLGTVRIYIIAKKVVFHHPCWTAFIDDLYTRQKQEEDSYAAATRTVVQSPGPREEDNYPLLLCPGQGRDDLLVTGTGDEDLWNQP